MSSVHYPVALNLDDLLTMCERHRKAIDRLLLGWIADGPLVQTDDGPAIRLRDAETPVRQRQLSGLIDLLARQVGPGQIGRPIRSYGLRDGRWCALQVRRQPRLW
jgi:hypothetical protein